MNPILAILGEVFSELGFDPRQLVGVAFHDGVLILRNWLENHWLQKVPDIAQEMRDQGWTLQSVSTERPTPPQDYCGRVIYKLWKRAAPGGWLRDWLRDMEDRPVTAAVAAQLSPTDHEHNIRAIIAAVLSAAFDPILGPSTPPVTN